VHVVLLRCMSQDSDVLPHIPTVGDFVPGYEAFTWPSVGAAFSWASAWRLPVIAACCARSIKAQHHENLAPLIEHRRRFYSAKPCKRKSACCSG
jgi:hypothetical protein